MNNYILLFRIKLKSLNSKNDNKQYHSWDFFFFTGGFRFSKIDQLVVQHGGGGDGGSINTLERLQWPESGAVCRRAEG